MLIGITSKISYLKFFGALFPVALAGFAVCIAVIWAVYRKEMRAVAFLSRPQMPDYRIRRPLLMKALLACAGVLVAFSLGYPYSLVAATGAVVLLLTGGVKTETILEGVDWTLLLFFSGLFVVMRGVELSGIAAAVINRAGDITSLSPVGRIAGLSAVSAILSNVVSNVPAVMLLKPLMQTMGESPIAWLALAMSSTLAGNLTLIGSVANLIVAQQARRRVEIGFVEYIRVGALITVITMAIGILVLIVEVKMARGAEAFAGGQSEQRMTVTVVPASSASKTFGIVLLCDNDDKRAKGLQGFRELKNDEAALFVFEVPEAVTFWMGSVSYPIDIIFIGPDKRVVSTYQNRRPGSRDYFRSIKKVSWVLETAAGSGIKVGDEVRIEGLRVMGHGSGSSRAKKLRNGGTGE